MGKEAYDAIINWFPMLLLIGVWLFFVWQMRNNGPTQSNVLSELRRRNDVLEKTVRDHDARLQDLERKRNL